jgi:hypothetical protein
MVRVIGYDRGREYQPRLGLDAYPELLSQRCKQGDPPPDQKQNEATEEGVGGDGALAVRLPKHARKELEAYLGCGQLCRGFCRFRCCSCGESRLVGFSCRGFLPVVPRPADERDGG